MNVGRLGEAAARGKRHLARQHTSHRVETSDGDLSRAGFKKKKGHLRNREKTIIRDRRSLTCGAAVHTPSTAAQTRCLAACAVLPAMSAALARAGGAAASSEGRCPRISKSRFRIAAPASGLASAARPSASRSRDICETPTGDASVTASALESMASSAGAIAAMTCVFAVPEAVKFEPSAASPNGRACITGSTKLVAPSNAAPAASSNAERPEASGAWLDAFV
jgi:hypothetical protein